MRRRLAETLRHYAASPSECLLARTRACGQLMTRACLSRSVIMLERKPISVTCRLRCCLTLSAALRWYTAHSLMRSFKLTLCFGIEYEA